MQSITIKLADDLKQMLEKNAVENKVSISHYVRALIYKGLTLEQSTEHDPLVKRIGEMMRENLILTRELIGLSIRNKEAVQAILVNAESCGKKYIREKEYAPSLNNGEAK